MSWLRYDDRFTADPRWDNVSYAARWHYVALVEMCGATGRYDGTLTLRQAERISDVPDPEACLAELATAGKIEVNGDVVTVPTISDHIPPPHVRQSSEKAKIRMRRHRAHRNGDHSTCRPEHCPDVPVTPLVTRNTGTGRDGTGTKQQKNRSNEGNVTANANDVSNRCLNCGGWLGRENVAAGAVLCVDCLQLEAKPDGSEVPS